MYDIFQVNLSIIETTADSLDEASFLSVEDVSFGQR
jgi:hypothetical protein